MEGNKFSNCRSVTHTLEMFIRNHKIFLCSFLFLSDVLHFSLYVLQN